MVKSLRFAPPNVALDSGLEWILQRALGPLDWACPDSTVVSQAAQSALQLDVAARIAARQPQAALLRELGPDGAHVIRDQFLGTIGRCMQLDHSLELLLERAASFAIPCILLKHAALSRMGVLRAGSRSASDLDVLVPDARAFRAYLVRNGYRDLAGGAAKHQLAPLHDPSGVMVELHLHIPGITLSADARWATADDLLAARLTKQVGNALIPDPAIVAAHALVHGLAQHARAPRLYSPLKTFADLIDLRDTVNREYELAAQFLSSSLTVDDIASAIALTRSLESGDLDRAMEGGAGVILRHALAARLDRRYAARLRWRTLTQPGPSPLHVTPRRVLDVLRSGFGWARARAFGSRGDG